MPLSLRKVGRVARGTCLLFLPGRQQTILDKPAHLRISLALQQLVGQERWDDGLVLHLKPRHEKLRFRPVHRVVVDEQNARRAQLNGRYQGSQTRPLRLPGNAGKHKEIPHAVLIEHSLHSGRIVLRADRTDDAALCQGANDLRILLAPCSTAFGQRAAPEGFVQVPDNQANRFRLRKARCIPLHHLRASFAPHRLPVTACDRHDCVGRPNAFLYIRPPKPKSACAPRRLPDGSQHSARADITTKWC